MDNVTRLLMQSSGGKKDSTYLDDVFSTYLYKGNKPSSQVINNGIALGSSMSGNSINLSDTTEYEKLTRTSALSGVSAGKTFTLSAWVFIPSTSIYGQLFYVGNTGNATRVEIGFGNYINIAARDSDNTKFLDAYTASNVPITPGTWNHILVSMDMSSTSNRRVYVNDSNVSLTYDAYSNQNILFNESRVNIFGQYNNTNKLFGNLSNFYFDQTYRNLATTSNRRLFYAADGTPATGQASLSPVIYYSFDTLSTTNAGSGGDFTFEDSPSLGTFGPYKDSDAAKGGLVWIKSRTNTYNNILQDTENGTGKFLISNAANATTNTNQYITSFNNNGFTVGTDNDINNSSQDFASWSFRKAEGFFDVVTYTGTGSVINLSHSLGCVPGCVMIKKTSANDNWSVYHRGLDADNPENWWIGLNITNGRLATGGTTWNNTKPTSTHVTIGTGDQNVNTNGATYVAYIFAGGASTAATARSVDFDGSGDYLSIPDHSDFDIGSSEFTIEGWIKVDALNSNGAGWLTSWSSTTQRGWYFGTVSNKFNFSWSDTGSNINSIDSGYTVKADGQFHHYAVTRSGTTLYFYVDGVLVKTNTGSGDAFHNSTGPVAVGYNPDGGSGWELNGKISNLRFVKGTAVYTSSFRPSTTPLTSITNTKLLCCNNSSTTGSTVTPGTITANGNPTASSDSPFDDPKGFNFGEGGKQNIIKCGSHSQSTTTNVRIYTGWEPQWVMTKNTAQSSNWAMFDVMRGIVVGGDGPSLAADTNAAENGVLGANQFVIPHGDGFSLKYGGTAVNPGNGNEIIYIAIRRPDPLVAKPVEDATKVFVMDVGNGNTTQAFDSGFPVDWAITRAPASTTNWETGGRLIQGKWVATDTTSAESPAAYFSFDSNTGWMKNASAYNTTYQSWMWKRDAGFDVVAYEGTNAAGLQIRHSLNAVPEMIWTKNRDATENWAVYHKGLNGGTNPQDYALRLNTSDPEINADGWWNDTAPTATLFTVGNSGNTNGFEKSMIALLFASVEGISKVGTYSGSSYDVTINLGFTPRFMIVKAYNSASGNQRWQVMDTLRGMAAGATATNRMYLDINSAQQAGPYVTSVSSTGITLKTGYTYSNTNNYEYIYYAHA